MPEVSEAELFQQAPLIRFEQPGSIKEPSVIDRLMACSQSAERDDLLREHLSINEKINTFIAKAKSQRIAELGEQRAALWAQCRLLEDKYAALVNDAGAMNGRSNEVGRRLSQARADMAAADIKSFSSRFPNQQEISEWESRKVAARIALDAVIREHRAVQENSESYRREQHLASVQLHDAVERLRTIDSELNNIRAVKVSS